MKKALFWGGRFLPLIYGLAFAAPVFAQAEELDEAGARACLEVVEAARATREKAEAGDARAQYALGLMFLDKLKLTEEDADEEGISMSESGEFAVSASGPGEFADLKRMAALSARSYPDAVQILLETVIEPMAAQLGESPELPELEMGGTAQSEEETLARAEAFLRKSGQEYWIDFFHAIIAPSGDRPIVSRTCPFLPLRFGQNDYEVLYWFRRAAEQGLPEAQFALGKKAMSEWNSSEATHWFLKARAGGFVIAPESEVGELLAEYDAMTAFQKAAEAGDGEAAYALARFHDRAAGGTGVAMAEKLRHREQTAKWLRFAADRDVQKARLWLARVYMGVDDVSGIPAWRVEGLEILRRMADAGDAEAQELLSRFAETANARMQWLQRAAEQGDAEARKNLARAYERGNGVPQDEGKALFWMRAAAQESDHAKGWLKEFESRAALVREAQGKGFAALKAQYKLAHAYLPYEGAPFRGEAIYLFPDPDKAAEVFRRFLAGRDGIRDLDEKQKRQLENWQTQAQAFVAAHERATKDWRDLEQNARAGDVNAQVELGKRYQLAAYSKNEATIFGKIAEDQEAAFHWFSAAAQAGDAEAQYLLGEWFIENRRDRETARSWLEKASAQKEEPMNSFRFEAGMLLRKLSAFGAAEKGDAAAQYALAAFYGKGDKYVIMGGVGVERDTEQTLIWMHRAAESGYPPAQNELGTIYAWPGFAKMNLETSAHWLRKAAEAGHPLAQYFYGKARYLGRGAPANEKEGRRWLEAAARAGEMYDEGGNLKQIFDEETGRPLPEFAWLNLGQSTKDDPGCSEFAWLNPGQSTDDPGWQALCWLEGINPYGAEMSRPHVGALMANVFLQNIALRATLEKLAEKNDAEAQFALGVLFYYEQLSSPVRGGFFCKGCEADQYLPEEIAAFRARGVKWLRQAAKAGHVRARLMLRRIEIDDPRGKAGDLATARRVLCRQALLPDENACAPEEEEKEAEEFQELRQAARAGDASAAFRLGKALRANYGNAYDWPEDTPFQDGYPALARTRLEEARSWFLEAHKAGVPGAACHLSRGYQKEGNTVEALFWLLKAQPEMPGRWLEREDCPD
ncbi:MAG: sel1 repeat family protein [Zoogloeaceae bacterium]|nr:sel1 repeat family protein [Zoogloeaceae bacterium]